MYAAAKAQGEIRRCRAIEQLGRQLRTASEMAMEYEPGSLGYSAAWDGAEHVVKRLGELVDCTTPLEPALEMAVRRVLGGATGRDARNRRRIARQRR
jgi:hypothetical protein